MAARANRTARAKTAARAKTVSSQDSSTQDPARRPPGPPVAEPWALRLAAAAQGLEAVGLVVVGVFAAVSTAAGRSSKPANGTALTLLVFIVAALVAAIAVGLARSRPWSRVPAAMTQLCIIIAGITLLDGHRPEWAVPALVLAAACLAGLFTPASLRALNRPAGESPIKSR